MRQICRLLLAILLLPLSLSAQTYDVIIRNARIVDGTGAPWFRGEIAVRGDEIVAVSRRIEGTATRVIDARDTVVAPGFIDLHTHARRGIFETPSADNYILQGVTTLFEGHDGGSPVPLGEFFDRIAAAKTSPNMAAFIGQGSVRQRVVGSADRKATPEEIERMKGIVRQAMREGAFGLSTGLFYVPGTFTPTEEIVELARVAGEMGGIHTSHMRNEAAQVVDSVRETIRIGEEGGLPTMITHHKVAGVRNWGLSAETLKLVDEARARGVDVGSDQYPYTASQTSLTALLPRWALEGGRNEMLRRFEDPAARTRIREAIIENIRFDRGGGEPKNVQIAWAEAEPALAGKTLADVVRMRGKDVTVESAADVVIALLEAGQVRGIYHTMSEDDVVRILRHPATMVASDGEVPVFGKNSPHPRSYGTFARVLGRYVREQKVLTLEEAVRKMTSMPAGRVGIHDRGLVRPGMKADLAVFDPKIVADRATFEKPHQYAVGVSHVLVNGVLVVDEGRVTAARPGIVLRGAAAVPAAVRR
ncbi:MAG TPA: D-aminoacylase [Thermoanaerobaculia bacterium]|nr:D-aminoacylase [Thermoanaerobaculia bacterium]